MTPDIVTALRDAIDNPGTSGQVLLSPELATTLVAEVERLRRELDQRTDPELAKRLTARADYMDPRPVFAPNETQEVLDLRTAARLLGGDQ